MLDCGSEPQVVLDCRMDLGESVLWDDRTSTLVWVDINRGEIWSWNPFASADPKTVPLGERIGAIGLRETGGLVLALERAFAFLDDGSNTPHGHIQIPNMSAGVRLNDGRVDPHGRFLCGGMDESKPQAHIASLYSLAKDGSVTDKLDGIACTNSICWSPKGDRLYFTDMPQARIDAFDYEPATGNMSNRRTLADLRAEPGLADGSCIDAEGFLWNAQWGGGKLVRYRPDGTVEREVLLPVTNPTCLAFGGPDLDVLFVTSARFTLDEETLAHEPHAGAVLAFRPGVVGRLEHRFAG